MKRKAKLSQIQNDSGLSKGAFDRALRSGILGGILHRDDAGRRFVWARDAEAAVKMLRGESPGGKQALTGESPDDVDEWEKYDYSAQRARREFYEAGSAKLRYLKLSASLVDREETERRMTEILAELGGQILNVPVRIAGQLAATQDVLEVERVLDAELRTIMQEYALGEDMGD